MQMLQILDFIFILQFHLGTMLSSFYFVSVTMVPDFSQQIWVLEKGHQIASMLNIFSL